MADEDLTVKARIDDELSRPLDDIGDKVRRVGRDAEDSGRRAQRGGRGWDLYGRAADRAGKLAHTAGRLARGALIGIGIGIAALGTATTLLVRNSIGEAREAEKVGRTTAAIIKSTGKAAQVSARQVANLAESLSNKTGIDDEAIQSGSNLLLTFKQIRNEAGKGNKIFNRATAAAVDLSAAGFGSIESGSKMLGKALNDPLKGVTALGRAGVTFTAGQQETIKALVESNDLLGAQKIILGEVESQVGGVAKAQATFGDKAAVMWANVQEKLGTALLPYLERLQEWFVKKGGPALDHYVDIFENKGIPAIKRFVDQGRNLAEKYLPQVKDTLGDVADVTQTAAGAGKDLVDAFLGMPSWARKLLIGGAAGGILGKKLGLGSLLKGGAGGLASVVSKAKPLPVFVVNNGLPGDGVPGGGGGRAGNAAKWGTRLGAASAITAGPATVLGLTMNGFNNSREKAAANKDWANRQTSVGSAYGGVWGQMQMPDVKDMDDVGKHAAEVMARGLDTARASAAGFNAELDLVGSKKVKPEVRGDSIKAANDALSRFIGYQIDAGRPIAPYITINGYAQAMQQIATLTNAVHSIPSAGTDNGLTYVGGRGGTTPTTPRKSPRRDPVEPRAPRMMAGGGGGSVTIHPGAITVNNPSRDVDVERAIRNYVREREERS